MIDRGDIRQAIDRYQYLGLTAGRWLWSVPSIKAGLIAIQRSGRNGQRD